MQEGDSPMDYQQWKCRVQWPNKDKIATDYYSITEITLWELKIHDRNQYLKGLTHICHSHTLETWEPFSVASFKGWICHAFPLIPWATWKLHVSIVKIIRIIWPAMTLSTSPSRSFLGRFLQWILIFHWRRLVHFLKWPVPSAVISHLRRWVRRSSPRMGMGCMARESRPFGWDGHFSLWW